VIRSVCFDLLVQMVSRLPTRQTITELCFELIFISILNVLDSRYTGVWVIVALANCKKLGLKSRYWDCARGSYGKTGSDLCCPIDLLDVAEILLPRLDRVVVEDGLYLPVGGGFES